MQKHKQLLNCYYSRCQFFQTALINQIPVLWSKVPPNRIKLSTKCRFHTEALPPHPSLLRQIDEREKEGRMRTNQVPNRSWVCRWCHPTVSKADVEQMEGKGMWCEELGTSSFSMTENCVQSGLNAPEKRDCRGFSNMAYKRNEKRRDARLAHCRDWSAEHTVHFKWWQGGVAHVCWMRWSCLLVADEEGTGAG